MWTCELKSGTRFWIVDLNLITICVKLLRTLSVWLTDARCPHYFIKDCNLVDNSFSVETVASQLNSIYVSWLSTWFVDNYIRKCIALSPANVSSLFVDLSTNEKLQNAVSAVVDWRVNTALIGMLHALGTAELFVASAGSKRCLTIQSYICWVTELAKTCTHLPVYFTAFAFLHVAHKISVTGFTDSLTDALATIAGQLVSTRSHPSHCAAVSYCSAKPPS